MDEPLIDQKLHALLPNVRSYESTCYTYPFVGFCLLYLLIDGTKQNQFVLILMPAGSGILLWSPSIILD